VHLNDESQGNILFMESLGHVNASEFIVGTSPGDWPDVVSRAAVGAVGIHPWKLQGFQQDWILHLESVLVENSLFQVGEIGLDAISCKETMHLQEKVLGEQLKVAARLGRTVSIHCVKAFGKLEEVLRRELSTMFCPRRLNFHSWSGSAEMTKHLLRIEFVAERAFFGVSLAVNGKGVFPFMISGELPDDGRSVWVPHAMRKLDRTVIWRNSLTGVAKLTPWDESSKSWNKFSRRLQEISLSRLLLETDLSGRLHAELRLTSLMTTCLMCAHAFGKTVQEILSATLENFSKFTQLCQPDSRDDGAEPLSKEDCQNPRLVVPKESE